MSILSRYNSTLLEPIPHGTPERPLEEMCFPFSKESSCGGTFSLDQHWHPEIEILYIEEGEFSGEVNLDQGILHPGDFMFAGSQDLHALKGLCEKSLHEALIFHPKVLSFSYGDELQQTLISPLLSGSITFPHFFKPEDSGYEQIAPLLLEVFHIAKNQPENWYIDCKLLLIKILYLMNQNGVLLPTQSLLSSNELQKIERYKLLTSYMDDHLSEPISLDELASLTATNPGYLCRFFKEISGISPIQYLINRRIEMAASLLRESNRSVLEIAMDCGFENVSYFIRKFKQKKGCTPGEYRN